MSTAESAALVPVAGPALVQDRVLRFECLRADANISMPSERDIVECAAAISVIARANGFSRRLEIGALILDRLIIKWQNDCGIRQATGQSSFRRLAEALEGTMSKSDLYRCAMVCQVCRRLPFIANALHITVSHIEAVDGIPLGEQERLLREAEAQRWSVRQLRRAKLELMPASGRIDGKAAAAAIRRVAELEAEVLNELDATSQVLSSLCEQDRSGKCVAFILKQLAALSDACAACVTSYNVAQAVEMDPRVNAQRPCDPILVASSTAG